ncbi:MAG: hypothetical protein M1820_009118 [Bogoriella megaspora]|nr:MAG: hypothetical protein M1820_009118 [Bogoriella megaspora]
MSKPASPKLPNGWERPKIAAYITNYRPKSSLSLPSTRKSDAPAGNPFDIQQPWAFPSSEPATPLEADAEQISVSILNYLATNPSKPLPTHLNNPLLCVIEAFRHLSEKNSVVEATLRKERKARQATMKNFEAAERDWRSYTEQLKSRIFYLEADLETTLALHGQPSENVTEKPHELTNACSRTIDQPQMEDVKRKKKDLQPVHDQPLLMDNFGHASELGMSLLSRHLAALDPSDDLLSCRPMPLASGSYLSNLTTELEQNAHSSPTASILSAAFLPEDTYSDCSSSGDLLPDEFQDTVSQQSTPVSIQEDFEAYGKGENGQAHTETTSLILRDRAPSAPMSTSNGRRGRNCSFELGDDGLIVGRGTRMRSIYASDPICRPSIESPRRGRLYQSKSSGTLMPKTTSTEPDMHSIDNRQKSRIPSPVPEYLSLAQPRREDSMSSMLTAIHIAQEDDDRALKKLGLLRMKVQSQLFVEEEDYKERKITVEPGHSSIEHTLPHLESDDEGWM